MSPVARDLHLVPASPDHAELWHAWRGEEAARRHNPLTIVTVEELRARLARCGTDLSQRGPDEYRWMVAQGDALIGTVSLKDPNWGMGHGEVAYQLGALWHGRGLGTRSVTLLIERVFEASSLARLFAYVSVDNVASRRLLARLGFRGEGVLREHYVIEGRRVDEAVYGLLRREWTRLAPDAGLRQRTDEPG